MDDDDAGTQTVREWASSVELTRPVRLGDVERQVLARRVSVPPGQGRPTIGDRVRYGIAVVLFGSLYLAPLAPLVLLPDAGDIYASENGLVPAGLLASVGAVVPLAVLVIWLTNKRRRDAFVTVSVIVTPVVALTAWLLLRASTLEITAMVAVWTLVGAVASVLVCVLVLVASRRGEPEVPLAERLGAATPEDFVRLRERTIALRVLYDRGLVDARVYEQAIDMPLGTWDRLDPEGAAGLREEDDHR